LGWKEGVNTKIKGILSNDFHKFLMVLVPEDIFLIQRPPFEIGVEKV